MRLHTDDLGLEVSLPVAVRRVVSLVPSLTESIAVEARELLVGCTDWCTHPADLDVRRVGGTKWPDISVVIGLAPDVVIANAEENREQDLDQLRAAGIPVYVTGPATVDQALSSLTSMFAVLGLDRPDWIDTAREVWAHPDERLRGLRTAAFIWRRPWMAVGRNTFASDVLQRLGLMNVFASDSERYPTLSADAVSALDVEVVLLPDEPYLFTDNDGPEAFTGRRCALISGRHLTWYGPSLVEARAVLADSIATPVIAL